MLIVYVYVKLIDTTYAALLRIIFLLLYYYI